MAGRAVHPASLSDEALLKQCELGKGRGSGPGGQHRNKVETKVMLEHVPSGVKAHAGERRSVADNTRVAVFRLRLALAVEVRTAVPLGDARSELWKSRCSPSGQISCNPKHKDFPTMLAELLDMAAACGFDTQKAAIRLGCTHSQLVKFLKEHAPAAACVNRGRQDRGMGALK